MQQLSWEQGYAPLPRPVKILNPANAISYILGAFVLSTDVYVHEPQW